MQRGIRYCEMLSLLYSRETFLDLLLEDPKGVVIVELLLVVHAVVANF